MEKVIKITIIALVAAMVVGCCNCRFTQNKNRMPLAGGEWQLIQLNGKAVDAQDGQFTFQLLAENSRVAGVGACNRLMGQFETSAKKELRFSKMATTMMACIEGMELESEFLRMFESVTHYNMDGSMLLLLSKGEVVAIFQPKVEF